MGNERQYSDHHFYERFHRPSGLETYGVPRVVANALKIVDLDDPSIDSIWNDQYCDYRPIALAENTQTSLARKNTRVTEHLGWDRWPVYAIRFELEGPSTDPDSQIKSLEVEARGIHGVPSPCPDNINLSEWGTKIPFPTSVKQAPAEHIQWLIAMRIAHWATCTNETATTEQALYALKHIYSWLTEGEAIDPLEALPCAEIRLFEEMVHQHVMQSLRVVHHDDEAIVWWAVGRTRTLLAMAWDRFTAPNRDETEYDRNISDEYARRLTFNPAEWVQWETELADTVEHADRRLADYIRSEMNRWTTICTRAMS